jgi:SAM-dependent methyltransferase
VSQSSRRPYGRRFARYYDAIYHGLVDYEGDVDFLEAIFRRYRLTPKSVLDLGCGTGNHDFPLQRRGYEVTGVDQSAEMLSFARKKAGRGKPQPRFVQAAMQSFRLGRTFDAAICMFGAFDYLVRWQDAAQCLAAVRAHLTPQGLFIFEYWQTSAVRPGHQSWLDRKVEGHEILRLSDSSFDRRRSLLSMEFHYLVLRAREVVDRFTERHVVRTYTRREMASLLDQSRFVRVGEFAGTPERKGFTPVTPTAFRIMAVARPK